MNHDAIESTLSLAGLQRRDAMREEMLDAFATMTRTRRMRRRTSIGAGVAMIAVAAVWVGARVINPASTPVAHGTNAIATVVTAQLVETITTPANTDAIEFAYVDNGSSSLVQYVQPESRIVEIIDDTALIETLAQMNRPAGLIEIGQTVRLTRDVADDAGGDASPKTNSSLGNPLFPGNRPPFTGV